MRSSSLGLVLICAVCMLVKSWASIFGVRLSNTIRFGLNSVSAGGVLVVLCAMVFMPNVVFAFPVSDVVPESTVVVSDVIPEDGAEITVVTSSADFLGDEEVLKYYKKCPAR